MVDPRMDFKDQLAEARRSQILMGAAQVFAEKGFHKATTKEIARAARVSEGTIYNYFDNKRELLLAMVKMLGTQSFRNLILDRPPEDPREFLKMVLHDRFQLIQNYGHIMAPLFAEVFADASLREAVYLQIGIPVTGLIEDYLQQQMDLGKLRQVNPAIVTRAVIGAMILNATIKLTGLDERYAEIDADEIIETLVTLYLDGLLISSD